MNLQLRVKAAVWSFLLAMPLAAASIQAAKPEEATGRDVSKQSIWLPGLQFETRLTDAVFQNRFVTFWFECLLDSERSVRHQRVH
jgi:hypothetical protein